MTTALVEGLEASPRRIARWSGAFICALVFHGLIIAVAVLAIRQDETEDGGQLAIDLPPLSVESTSMEAENSEDAKDATTAPPPTDATDASQPADAEPEPEPAPDAEPAPPEPTIEKAEIPEVAPEPVEELVPEVSKVPEPEVVVPKVVEKKAPVEKAKPEVKKPAAKKTAQYNRDIEKDGKKAGPKSDSKAASAAAASGGKFNPNAISRPHPPYPASARASRIEGSVVVRYTVSPSGSVTGVSVLSASPPGVFNGVTVSAVRNWRFRPSATGGSGTTTIRFKLR